jgi:hypothetical protein
LEILFVYEKQPIAFVRNDVIGHAAWIAFADFADRVAAQNHLFQAVSARPRPAVIPRPVGLIDVPSFIGFRRTPQFGVVVYVRDAIS